MSIQFQGESAAYRAARRELLAAEKELRRLTGEVAQRRSQLPPGHLIEKRYAFETLIDGATAQVDLADLFVLPDRSLVVYGFMFADSERPCPMCNAFLDAFDGVARHVGEQLNLAIVAQADATALAQWQSARGWHNLKLYSHAGSTFAADYFCQSPDGAPLPMLNVFEQTSDGIRHSYATELFFEAPEPQQHPRHMDALMPLWNLFDLTREGRPPEWMPVID